MRIGRRREQRRREKGWDSDFGGADSSREESRRWQGPWRSQGQGQWHGGAPLDDGGDTITSYSVEWDTLSNFSSAPQSHDVLYLAAGSPFSYTITGLTMGTQYYVRIRAVNSQGSGPAQATTPAAEHPRVPQSQAAHAQGQKLRC